MMMKSEPHLAGKQALIVLGMHRSGTSSVAGVLCQLGAAAPRTLMPEHPDNPKGYWESLAIVAENEQLLQAGGSFWNDWRQFECPRPGSAHRTAAVDRMAAVLNAEFDDAPLIVLKDPRICRMYPLWAEALGARGYTALAIMPIRHPMEVAASLSARDGMSVAHGLLVWLRHVLDAELATRDRPRHFLEWSAFIADWRAEVISACERLAFQLPAFTDITAVKVDDFVDGSLRRQSAGAALPKDTPDWIGLTHSALRRLVANPEDSEALVSLDEVRGELNAQTRTFGPVLAGIEVQVAGLRKAHLAELSELRASLRQATHELNLQMIARADTETALHDFMARTQNAEDALKRLTAAHEDAERHTEAAQLESLERIAELEAGLATSREACETLEQSLAQQRVALEEDAEAWAQKAEQLNSDLRVVRHELELTQSELLSQQYTSAQLRGKLTETESRAEAANAERSALLEAAEEERRLSARLVEQRDQTIESLRAEAESAVQRTERLISDLRVAQHEREHARSELAALQRDMAKLQENLLNAEARAVAASAEQAALLKAADEERRLSAKLIEQRDQTIESLETKLARRPEQRLRRLLGMSDPTN
jgi:hypothetical protein